MRGLSDSTSGQQVTSAVIRSLVVCPFAMTTSSQIPDSESDSSSVNDKSAERISGGLGSRDQRRGETWRPKRLVQRPLRPLRPQ
jgi:hypothetical protein